MAEKEKEVAVARITAFQAVLVAIISSLASIFVALIAADFWGGKNDSNASSNDLGPQVNSGIALPDVFQSDSDLEVALEEERQKNDNLRAQNQEQASEIQKQASEIQELKGERRTNEIFNEERSVPNERESPSELGSELNVSSGYAWLEELLQAGNWQDADEFTAQLLRQASNKPSGKLKADDIPCSALLNLDRLWSEAEGDFGFSEQREIFTNAGGLPGQYHGYNASPELKAAWGKFSQEVNWPSNLTYEQARQDFSRESKPGHLPWKYRALISGTATSYVISRLDQCED
ncbi:MAG: GUN4 domain-containing protein [Cyanobacteria bacterium P01_G01_bin.38]